MKRNHIGATAAALVISLCAAGAQANGLTWVPNSYPASGRNVIVGGQEPGRTLPKHAIGEGRRTLRFNPSCRPRARPKGRGGAVPAR